MNLIPALNRLEDEKFNNYIGRRSTVHMKNAILAITQNESEECMYEDWFRKPLDVAEQLADRLAFSEQCIKEGVSWEEYRKLSKEYRAGQ